MEYCKNFLFEGPDRVDFVPSIDGLNYFVLQSWLLLSSDNLSVEYLRTKLRSCKIHLSCALQTKATTQYVDRENKNNK